MPELDPAARTIGAANTLVRKDGGWFGFNTDPDGAVGALEAAGRSPRGRRAVVLGAGGAGRAAAFGLSRAGASVTLVNRTRGRAEGAARTLGCRTEAWERRGDCVRTAEIVVSCLSVRERTIERECLHAARSSWKPSIRPRSYPGTQLSAAASSSQAWNGSCIKLVPAFALFTGLAAPAAAMREALRSAAVPVAKPGLALIGFMGAGKSTIGELIARRTGRRFIDTDASIESGRLLRIPDFRPVW